MLDRTFVHCSGVGLRAERRLWEQGCSTWDDFLAEPKRFSVGSAGKSVVRSEIEASRAQFDAGAHQFFAKRLGQKHAWRAFEAFRHSCCYLDIETNGGFGSEAITIIGMYDGVDFTALVKNEDLEEFRDRISHFSMIVTFFGTGFDVPILQKAFPDAPMDQIHIDLCPLFRQIGVRGGLKKIEQLYGIERPDESDGLNGLDAIRLWRQHERGRSGALETLIAYNREDVVNMEKLAEIAISKLWQATLDDEPLESPKRRRYSRR